MRSPSFAQTIVRQPSVGAYRSSSISRAGIDVSTPTRLALDHARQLHLNRFAAGAVLVQLYLSEGDVDAAWRAADRYGPGLGVAGVGHRGAKLGRRRCQTCTSRSSRRICNYPTASCTPTSPRHWRRGRLLNKAVAVPIRVVIAANSPGTTADDPSLMKALDAEGALNGGGVVTGRE